MSWKFIHCQYFLCLVICLSGCCMGNTEAQGSQIKMCVQQELQVGSRPPHRCVVTSLCMYCMCIVQLWYSGGVSCDIYFCLFVLNEQAVYCQRVCDIKICKIHVRRSYSPTHTYPCACAHTRDAGNSCSIFEWVQSESMSNQCPSFPLSTAGWKTQHMAGWMDISLHRQRNTCIEGIRIIGRGNEYFYG